MDAIVKDFENAYDILLDRFLSAGRILDTKGEITFRNGDRQYRGQYTRKHVTIIAISQAARYARDDRPVEKLLGKFIRKTEGE